MAKFRGMLSVVGNLRTCIVSFCEPKGSGRFSVEVTAESTFEAAVRALKLFRLEPWCTEYNTGYLEIAVKAPPVQYKVLIEDLDSWLQEGGGSPRETASRERLKKLLE